MLSRQKTGFLIQSLVLIGISFWPITNKKFSWHLVFWCWLIEACD